jgi:hypothetical protein
MKIKEIISESQRDEIRRELSPQNGFNLMQGDGDFDEYDITDLGNDEPEMELTSNADTKMINAVKRVCDEYKGQGHAQVEILPFISKVIELAKKPVNLADLIAINKKSPEIRSMIDSIDDKKIKFKNMSVKNEDPKAQAEKKDATVGGMAGRAAGRNRGL